MPFVERDGVRLYYERGGGGPELLFVPGWWCDHTFYAPQFEHFASKYMVTVLAIVSDDPGPIHPTEEAARIYGALATEMAGPRGEDVRRAWVQDGAGPTASDELRRLSVDTMCSVPLPITRAMIEGVTRWNGVGALVLCEVPLLILNPSGKSNDPYRIRPLNAGMHVGATVGAGHFHQLETPDQVNAMIGRFLELI